MKFISSKRKIILLGVIFNVVLEFWIFGVVGFFNPVLIISIFFLYLSFFSMLVDLLIRFNLRDYHIILFGFFFGMFQETFGNGSVFNDPNFLGVNLINIFLINILWWGILQGVFGLYFSNRIVRLDREKEKKMGKVGWGLAVGVIVFMFLVSILEKTLPDAPIIAYVISIVLMVGSFLAFLLLKKNKSIIIVEKIKFVDNLITVQFILSILMGVLQLVIDHITVTYLFILWSLFISSVYIIMRLKGRVLVG